MKFRPLHDRVVIKRIEAEEKTSGGTEASVGIGRLTRTRLTPSHDHASLRGFGIEFFLND